MGGLKMQHPTNEQLNKWYDVEVQGNCPHKEVVEISEYFIMCADINCGESTNKKFPFKFPDHLNNSDIVLNHLEELFLLGWPILYIPHEKIFVMYEPGGDWFIEDEDLRRMTIMCYLTYKRLGGKEGK